MSVDIPNISLGACVIVEPRPHKALKFVVDSVHRVLPTWPIYVCHGINNEKYVRSELIDLKPNFINLNRRNLTIRQYNQLLTSPSFYEKFIDYEYILIFQTDSILFAQSPHRIEEFLGYDYVGAPWSLSQTGGNGGLSLRKVKAMIDILKQYPQRNKKKNVPEDVYFASLPLHFAPSELAQKFSVEGVYYDKPLGTHKFWSLLGVEDWLRLRQYAPEIDHLFRLNLK